MKSSVHSPRRGFTLVEVALAIVIVSIVILAAIGLLLPSQRAIDDVLSGGQATRLRQEIEKEFSVLRPGEASASVKTPFDKAYNAVKNGATQNGLLCAFFYRAEKGGTDPDGRLRPFTGDIREKRAGEDYVVQAAVMRLTDFAGSSGYKDALEGRLFVVRLLPLEGLVSENPVAPQLPLEAPLKPLVAAPAPATPLADFLSANPAEAYPVAVIPAAAEFYEATDVDNPGIIFNAMANPKTGATPGGKAAARPVITLNIGFNR
jgi:prepilin-type N-terminal cleavage/methylation domain-containing protein